MTEKKFGDYIINVDNICKTFPNGVKALCNFSTNIRRAEVVVVIGPSGSGKSTLLRSLNRLETAEQGQILVDGVDIFDPKTDINKVRAEMGMVFQSFNLFPHLSILGNVTISQKLVRKRGKEEREKKAMMLLEKVGIADKANAYPANLSGGQ